MEKKLGQEPAFSGMERGQFNPHSSQQAIFYNTGISKRFYAACFAMQGLLAHNCDHFKEDDLKESGVAKRAFMVADEMLKQEGE